MPQPMPGPIVLPSDVETVVRDTMKEWVPFYLAEIDEQQGRDRGDTQKPRSWLTASENAGWPEETPPALIVVCPGTVEDPQIHGEHATYAATWEVHIGVSAGGATDTGTRALASRYAGAVLYTLAQQQDMGGLAEWTRWKGFRTDVIPRKRALMACEVLAHVHVRHVVDTRGLLPRTAPDDPTAPADPTPTPTGSRLTVRPVRR